jgi:hypothetical protein
MTFNLALRRAFAKCVDVSSGGFGCLPIPLTVCRNFNFRFEWLVIEFATHEIEEVVEKFCLVSVFCRRCRIVVVGIRHGGGTAGL